jgi:hypothetical protein
MEPPGRCRSTRGPLRRRAEPVQHPRTGLRAPLAVPELNRERTLKYLECCYRHGLSWDDAKQQIEDFLRQRGMPREGVVRQLTLAPLETVPGRTYRGHCDLACNQS